MRNKQEMFDLILGIAEKDERILAVYLNGSRANHHVREDIFQDYDIVYVVKETASFIEDKAWIDIFGERLYMQYPDEHGEVLGLNRDLLKNYGWLMQLQDGNRLDLHVSTLDVAYHDVTNEPLTQILLDKFKLLPEIPDASDILYHVQKPCEVQFSCVCNEFWWCLNNVAKGCFREEILYVQDMLNGYVRPQLFKMLTWYVGIETNFSISVGKSGKYLNQWLPQILYHAYLTTYPPCDVQEIWKSVYVMCELMNQVGQDVAIRLGFTYNTSEAKASYEYLKHVHSLPKDAKEVYSHSLNKQEIS